MTEQRPSEEERALDRAAKVPRASDGGFNTVLKSSRPNLVWRISKGTDLERRARHISNWIKETDVTDVFAGLHVAPEVKKEYSRGSWLTDTQHRVATLQVEYTEDLHDALSPPKKGKVSLASSESFGADVGRLLVQRLCQLGATCTLHGDLKPENTLLLLTDYQGGVTLSDVKIIDFDPQFLFAGCDCMELAKEMQVALFAILNLVLFWTWFEVDKEVNSRRGKASEACRRVLEDALARSSFPLDELAPKLPRQLMQHIRTWSAHYRDKKVPHSLPLLQEAVSRFQGLRAARYTSGPRVAGQLVSATSFVSGDIESARARLARIAKSVRGMSCA